MLQRTRSAVYDRIQRSPELQKLQDELLEEELDLHEGKIRQLGFEKDNTTALLAFLNAKGRERGYGRYGVEVKGEFEHRHKHAHLHAKLGQRGIDLSRYSDEQLEAIEELAGLIESPKAGSGGGAK